MLVNCFTVVNDWRKQAVPGLPDDWPERTAAAFGRWTGKIRKATDRPSANLARRLVYGMIIFIAGITALILLTVGGIRLINTYLPADVWSAYLLLGGFFSLLGLWIWSKRPSKAASGGEET